MHIMKKIFLPAVLLTIICHNGCGAVAGKEQRLYNIALFVEYLVRGDEKSAYEIAAGEIAPGQVVLRNAEDRSSNAVAGRRSQHGCTFIGTIRCGVNRCNLIAVGGS